MGDHPVAESKQPDQGNIELDPRVSSRSSEPLYGNDAVVRVDEALQLDAASFEGRKPGLARTTDALAPLVNLADVVRKNLVRVGDVRREVAKLDFPPAQRLQIEGLQI